MKQLLFAVSMLIVCSCAYAQSGTGQDTTKSRTLQSSYGFDYKNVAILYTFVPPKDTVKLRVADSGAIAFKSNRYWSWTGYRWDTLRASGSGGGSAPVLYTAGRGLGLYANQFRLGGEADSTISLNMQGEDFIVDNADTISMGTLRSGSYGTMLVEIAGQGKVLLQSAGPIQISGASLDASGTPTGQFGNRLSYGTNDVSVTNVPIRLTPISTEPSGLNGYIYYNSSLNKFRVYVNGSWQDMAVGSPAVPTLQQVLTAGSDISTIDNTINLGEKTLTFNILSGGNPYTKIRLGKASGFNESILLSGKASTGKMPFIRFLDDDYPAFQFYTGIDNNLGYHTTREDGDNSNFLYFDPTGDGSSLGASSSLNGSSANAVFRNSGYFGISGVGAPGQATLSLTADQSADNITVEGLKDDGSSIYQNRLFLSSSQYNASYFGGSVGGISGFPEHGFATYPNTSLFFIGQGEVSNQIDFTSGILNGVGQVSGTNKRFFGLTLDGTFYTGPNNTPSSPGLAVYNNNSVQMVGMANPSGMYIKPSSTGVLQLATAVSSVGIVAANGFVANVSNPTTTPTFTLTVPATAGNIFYGAPTNAIGNNNNFSFNSTNVTLGIGMGASASNSNAKLHVLSSGVPPHITALFEGSAGGNEGGAKIKLGKQYNGTPVAAGDQLYTIESLVAGFGPVLGATSYIRTVATQAHTFSGTGTIMAFGNSAHGIASVSERFRLDSIGGVSVGSIFGGANLAVAPGIARPLFRLKSSTAVTAPSNVDFAYSGNNMQITPNVGKVQLRAGLTASNYGTPIVSAFRNLTDEGNVTTGNTALHSYTLPANLLAFDSSIISFEFAGTFFGSTSSKQVSLEFNGTAVFTVGPIPAATTTDFEVKGWLVRTGTSTAKVVASFYSNGVLTGYQSLTSLDFTTTKVLRLMGQASGVGAATNDIVVHMSRVNQSN